MLNVKLKVINVESLDLCETFTFAAYLWTIYGFQWFSFRQSSSF